MNGNHINPFYRFSFSKLIYRFNKILPKNFKLAQQISKFQTGLKVKKIFSKKDGACILNGKIIKKIKRGLAA